MLHMWLAKMYYSPRLSPTPSLRRIWEKKINNKLLLSLTWQPDFCGRAGKGLSITGQPGGFGSWDSHISFCTHHTQTFKCGEGDRGTTAQKSFYREIVLHFKEDLSLYLSPNLPSVHTLWRWACRGFCWMWGLETCITAGTCPRECPGWDGWGLFSLLALTGVSQEHKILPSLSAPKTLWPVSSRKGGMLAEQCGFLLLKYRWQIEFGSKQLKMVLNLACSLPWHHSGQSLWSWIRTRRL